MEATERQTGPLTYLLVLAICALGLGVRLVQLDDPVLRWDEGWSVAYSQLSWPEMMRISAGEWQPPLYYGLIKGWILTGKTVFGIRYLSVLTGVLVIPLSWVLGYRWTGRARVGVLAALLVALSPALVYYGQVARMYALSASFVVLAGYGWVRHARQPSRRWAGLGVAGTVAALYTLYYSALPLAAIYGYTLVRSHTLRTRVLVGAGLSLLLYSPWMIYSVPSILKRVGGPEGAFPSAGDLSGHLRSALTGLAFSYDSDPYAVPTAVFIFVAGAALARSRIRQLALPAAALSITVLGVAFGASATGWLQARHLVPAAPFLGLGLAWALDALASRWRPLAPAGLALLALVFWPTASQFVYAKNLEVVDPFDPSADAGYLAQHARPDDIVFFTILSLAGWYEQARGPGAPDWSYALRWTPAIDSLAQASGRLRTTSQVYDRLWVVLYKGTVGENQGLKEWLDNHLYPARSEWGEQDHLYLLYLSPGGGWTEEEVGARFEGGITLHRVRYTPSIEAGGPLDVELVWSARRIPQADYTVFIHAVTSGEELIGQHDGPPAGGSRPTTGWQPSEALTDRHGLVLPPDFRGVLRLRVGLYEPSTGERIPVAGGGDYLTLGRIVVGR